MPKKDEKERIEDLKKELYSKSFSDEEMVEDLPKKTYDVKSEWQQSTEISKRDSVMSKVSNKVSTKKILLASFGFLIIAVAIATFNVFNGFGIFSSDNITFSIDGPIATSGGEDFSVAVHITNNNDEEIEDADLVIIYPRGSYDADSNKELSRERYPLGAIKPNETVNEVFHIKLFGEQGEKKEIVLELEFRFEGSSATLKKKEIYVIEMTSSPIDMSMEILKEVTANQEMDILISISSNSNETLEDILLELDYPFGFTFKSADPEPLYGASTWELGDLPPSGKHKIRITGLIEGQDGEDRIFRASIGKRDERNEKQVGTMYTSTVEATVIKRPFLALDLKIGGVSFSEYTAKGSRSIRGDIVWKNNIPTQILDGEVRVFLNGEVLDRFSISAGSGGFYQSIDNSIVWGGSGSFQFDSIEPGASGVLGFSFASLPLYTNTGKIFRDPVISLEVRAEGRQVSSSGATSFMNTSLSRDIKIDSDIRLSSRVLHFSGPFQNTGAMPPQVEKETTYTIIWTVTNSSNEVKDVIIRANLPTYMRWMGVYTPLSEQVVFNNIGGSITWNLGKVSAGAGVTVAPREISFQVAFTPSISQINREPRITSEIVLSGEDTFTDNELWDTNKSLTIDLRGDPQSPGKFNRVVK